VNEGEGDFGSLNITRGASEAELAISRALAGLTEVSGGFTGFSGRACWCLGSRSLTLQGAYANYPGNPVRAGK
jgi:hypothetical protein